MKPHQFKVGDIVQYSERALREHFGFSQTERFVRRTLGGRTVVAVKQHLNPKYGDDIYWEGGNDVALVLELVQHPPFTIRTRVKA